jgi:Na+-transporting NADH:ubiquinone oxidoreductase subunit A
VTGIQSAPLAPDEDFILKEKAQFLQAGFNALSKLTAGKVHLTVSKKSESFTNIQGVEKHIGSGKHPVGLVSTQIAKIDPINKGERVWVLNAFDVATIGELFETGVFNQEKIVALTGTGFKKNAYTKALPGVQMADITKNNLENGKYRLISGDVLTGLKSNTLRYYDYQVTAIPEGDDYDFFGWNLPRPNKFSVYKAGMFSFLTPKKKYDLNTNTNGEHRGFVLTGEYEKVCPLDIYPMQLLKAILVSDIDNMEQMGIYEVAPEDFALTEYVCVSKQDHQAIVRNGLDLMMKEVG